MLLLSNRFSSGIARQTGLLLSDCVQSRRRGSSRVPATALKQGWPKDDEELSRWLDTIFHEDWTGQIESAARLPLEVFHDPRQMDMWMHMLDCDAGGRIARFFAVRALQHTAHGRYDAAFDNIETILGLSRQFANYGPTLSYLCATNLQGTGLDVLERWVKTVGPERKRLRRSLGLLRHHEAAFPSLENSIKADYIMVRNSLPKLPSWLEERWRKKTDVVLTKIAMMAPWERQRYDRLVNAIGVAIYQRAMADDWQPVVRSEQDLEDPRRPP